MVRGWRGRGGLLGRGGLARSSGIWFLVSEWEERGGGGDNVL